MEIDITKLNSNYVTSIPVSMTYSFKKEELKGTDLISLNNVQIEGEIRSKENDYQILLEVKGKMILPCAITLEPVTYPFSISIDQYFSEFENEHLENNKKVENKLDIFPIIWENILMEIPTKVVSEKAHQVKLEGDGWRLVTGDHSNGNHAFDALNDLLK